MIALALCACLLGVMIWNRNAVEAAQESLGSALVSTSWKISELVYEGEQLSTAIVLYDLADLPLEDLQLQVDVFWSRVIVLEALNLEGVLGLKRLLSDMDALLNRIDPVIYEQDNPPIEQLYQFREDITAKVIRTRLAWLDQYSNLSFEDLSPASAQMAQQKQRFENISVTILGAIVLYLMIELYGSSVAMKRERELTRMAEGANRAKSQFIATVSHEIRTPLNGVIGTASLLADTATSPEQAEYVNVLQQAAGVLLRTINDVLDFSKLEAGEFTIQSVEFDLTTILDAARGLYAPLAREKSLSFSVWHDPDAVPKLLGDAQRLQQVLHNLISNAIKFTSEGSVEVSAQFVEREKDGRAAGLYIWVSDTGIGIPKEQHARIFQPFGQSSGGLARAHGGTGLGLTISLNLCQAMQGDLTVSSSEGDGSVFQVFVPFTAVSTVAPEAPQPTGGTKDLQPDAFSLAALGILIVDDNKTNRFILNKYLKSWDGAPAQADSGARAIELEDTLRPDVILMDVQMPLMDGVTATECILENCQKQGRAPPIIIGVTANTMPEQVKRYRVAGMQDVLPKPVSKARLKKVLGDVMVSKTPDAA